LRVSTDWDYDHSDAHKVGVIGTQKSRCSWEPHKVGVSEVLMLGAVVAQCTVPRPARMQAVVAELIHAVHGTMFSIGTCAMH